MADKPTYLNTSGNLAQIPDDSDFYDGRRYWPYFLEAGKTLTIPARNNMIICGTYEIDLGGSLSIDATAKVCIT